MGAVATAPINIPGGKERAMKPDMFRQPVSIPAQVRSVMDAYRHLVEWPTSMRDTAHSIALKACGAALRGEIEAETARGLFAAFAEIHNLLAPETNLIAASRLQRDRDPHVR
jgi:hypothetical protein